MFFLCLLYAGCIVGLWTFLNSSHTFSERQRIIQGNSAQHCCSLFPAEVSFSKCCQGGEMLIKSLSAVSQAARGSLLHFMSRRNGSQRTLLDEVSGITTETPWPAGCGVWAWGYFMSLSLVQCSWGCAAPGAGRAEVGCWGGMLLRDTNALGRLEVLHKGASAGLLLCPAEMQPFCINLVLSSTPRSGLRNAKACENKEQEMRKLFPWLSEASALEWRALSA